jgi:PIN domain nuclease of toxin-antitoxin system
VRLLLDTHAYLWWLADDPKLGARARDSMADPAAIVYVSAASVWEISIKIQLGKLDFEGDPVKEIWSNGFVELPMTAQHADHAGRLPRHHDDPFDRMLIAQAKLEHLQLVSTDSVFESYAVSLLPA